MSTTLWILVVLGACGYGITLGIFFGAQGPRL